MDATPNLDSTELIAEHSELFDELLAASSPISELDEPQQDAWASGLLATWRSEIRVDEPAALDAAFRDFCVADGSAVALQIVPAIDRLVGPGGSTTLAPTSGWRVATGARPPGYQGDVDAGGSFIIGFAYDEIEHSVLAEIADGVLVDLILGPSIAEVVPDPDTVWEEMGQRVTVAELSVKQTADTIMAAWTATAAEPVDAPSVGLIMNQLVALARLRLATGDPTLVLDPIEERPPGALSFTEGMADDEITEANQWATGVLTSALRRSTTPTVDPTPESIAAAKLPLRGPIEALSIEDQRALVFLEWADWLGVIIGLSRAGAGAMATPGSLVDLVNSCPEVSTSVPAADRDYVEHAFAVAIDLWVAGEIVVDGQLTAAGHAALAPAAFEAWS